MAGPPPAYEEAMGDDLRPRGPPLPLIVHLQVWHYRSEGRSPTNNEGLAALFLNQNLRGWKVIPFEDDGVTGPGSHDQYVPVEVRFCHQIWANNDPGEPPMAAVRELFFKVAPQFIYQFFIGIGSTPHILNIFPIRVPPAFSSRYTHGYNLNPLNIRVNAFLIPGPAITNDVQSWLREAIDNTPNVLRILAAIVSLFLMHRSNREQGETDANIQRDAREADVLNVDVPQQLSELLRLFQQFRRRNEDHASQPTTQLANLGAAWNLAAGPLHQYLRLTNRMESRVRKLKNRERLSDQDLYELVQDGHQWTLHFSTMRQAVRPLIRLLERDYSDMMEKYTSAKIESGIVGAVGTCALTAVVLLCFWNPLGWATCATMGASGVGAVVGGLAGVGLHYLCDAERGKSFDKMDGVREFTIAIKELENCAKKAQEAIAAVFCNQIMRISLEALPEHAKRTLLETLGVDVDAMSSPVYTDELIRDRLKRFQEKNFNLRNMIERVQRDANIEPVTTEEAR